MKERVYGLGECSICKARGTVIRRGFFQRKSDRKIIQKYYCKKCRKSFSQQTLSYDYRLRKRYLNQTVFKLICKGVSQRGIAQILNIKQTTVALRVKKYGLKAREHLEKTRKTEDLSEIFFDEMETFEHSKCKPLTIPLAVNPKNRKMAPPSIK
jgi:transposase-like protein